ncbi:MAG: hypothetical protein LBR22_00885 [Desulfovibrio sp.]|nr:hypothetical protein [Desulfovibrio sp.]
MKCPRCGHGPDGIQKFGHAGDGRQRCRRKNCDRPFCATTETFLAHTRKDVSACGTSTSSAWCVAGLNVNPKGATYQRMKAYAEPAWLCWP